MGARSPTAGRMLNGYSARSSGMPKHFRGEKPQMSEKRKALPSEPEQFRHLQKQTKETKDRAGRIFIPRGRRGLRPHGAARVQPKNDGSLFCSAPLPLFPSVATASFRLSGPALRSLQSRATLLGPHHEFVSTTDTLGARKFAQLPPRASRAAYSYFRSSCRPRG